MVKDESITGKSVPEKNLQERGRKVSVTTFGLPGIQSGLTEDQVTQSTYVLAFALNDGMRERILVEVLDSQLDITREQAEAMHSMLDKCGLMTFNGACRTLPALAECVGASTEVMHMSVLIRCHLLRSTKHHALVRYRDFRAGCDAAAATVLALAESFQRPRRSSQGEMTPKRRHLIATIRSAVRRLSEPDEAFFDDEEHADGVAQLCGAAAHLTDLCGASAARSADLATQVVVTLLQAVHDDLADDGYVPQRSAMQAIIERELCPKLGVSPRLCCVLDAWVHMQQYLAFGDERILRQARQLLEKQDTLPDAAGGGEPDSGLGRPPQSELVLEIMKDHLATSANDAFSRYTAAQLPAILDVTATVSSVSQGQRELFLRKALSHSVDAELERGWERCQARARSNAEGSGHDGSASAPCTPVSMYIEWFQEVDPHLRAYVDAIDRSDTWPGSALTTFLRRCHQRIGERFTQWLQQTGDALTVHVSTVQAAAAFELDHIEKIRATRDGLPIKTWAAAEDLQSALMGWLSRQTAAIKPFVQRLCQQEKWQEAVSSNQHVAPSALELERLFGATTQSLTDMAVPTSGGVVRSMLELINGLALEYAHCVRAGCSSPNALIRPPPPLTRFKKTLADKAAAGLSFKNKVKEMEAKDPEHAAALEDYNRALARREQMSVVSLLLRVNSAFHLAHHLRVLQAAVAHSYERILGKFHTAPAAHIAALEGALDVGIHMLQEAAMTVQEYLGHSAVFVSMADLWYEQLYRHDVRGHNAHEIGVMSELDKIMNSIMDKAAVGVRGDAAAAVARATFAAFRTVLLQGGEYRNFVAEDADVIVRDAKALRDLFYADGHGVPQRELQKAAVPVNDVLSVMALETGLLCENMDSLMRQREEVGQSSSLCLKNGLDYSTLLCILSHRADRIASKYLKEHVKMPKMDGKRRGFLF